jgi:hypothetical protein
VPSNNSQPTARVGRDQAPHPLLRGFEINRLRGRVKPDYAHIRVPVVAIFRTTTKEAFFLESPPRNADERAALDQAYA